MADSPQHRWQSGRLASCPLAFWSAKWFDSHYQAQPRFQCEIWKAKIHIYEMALHHATVNERLLLSLWHIEQDETTWQCSILQIKSCSYQATTYQIWIFCLQANNWNERDWTPFYPDCWPSFKRLAAGSSALRTPPFGTWRMDSVQNQK